MTTPLKSDAQSPPMSEPPELPSNMKNEKINEQQQQQIKDEQQQQKYNKKNDLEDQEKYQHQQQQHHYTQLSSSSSRESKQRRRYEHISVLLYGLHDTKTITHDDLRKPLNDNDNNKDHKVRFATPDDLSSDDSTTSINKPSLPLPPAVIITDTDNRCENEFIPLHLTQSAPVVSDTPQSPTRRLSQFNFAHHLRRFSHSNMTLNRVGESMGSLGHRTLLQYVDSNDLYGLKTLLDTRHIPVDDRDENGTTILMVVASRGLTQFVREFLARGADVQAEDADNWSSLIFAAKYGHLDVIQMLLDHGADVEHRDMGGWTALMWAAYKGHTSIAELLVNKGSDVNCHGNYHLSPLLWASGRGHKEIVQILVQRGAKVNVGDKYGTTALIWACRRGYSEIVEILLRAGANVDTAGMYSWTALLVATSGGFVECVSALLEKRPNINALDKDGMTALSIACREGYQEIATALMANGAYINIQDRAGDTPLIHAVKGGHRGVVEGILKKHADVDIQGKERKTALYTAVEKGHTSIVKQLLGSNPDLEAATKDGDTALLRAVRNRNLEIVQMLLERRAKVSASDKRGDTCLHIAMRARSKAIVEALLRNPKNSQLLYRANKAGETPYAIDTNHQKTILGQVFGARRLNTNEDSEGMLGYELYSSALADVLSEPTLTTPITVGLYAKWGSGKSFLLTKLREEMNNFARQWAEPPIKATGLLFLVILHLSLILGMIIGLGTWSALWGVLSGVLFIVIIYLILFSIKYASNRYDVYWAYSFYHGIMKRLGRLRLILQVAFCHPPGAQSDSQAKPVRFHFAEASSAAPTGEGSVGIMLALLFEAIESHYGWLSTRLYRAFRPKPLKVSSGWRYRRMCCIPLVIIFELGFLTFVAGVSLIIAYFSFNPDTNSENVLVSIYVITALLVTAICTNLHILAKAITSLFTSQGRHLRKSMKTNEGAPLTALGAEVALMTDMVKCLDAFTSQQSRLVGVVDALDCCDTERILSVLSSIQTLLQSPNRPFVLLIAVDPHVIAKAAEANSRRLFTEGGIGGHDFLRNLVHLPVYLQNSGLRKVQRAQMTALAFKRTYLDFQSDEPTLGHSASARRLSNASEIMSSQEKLRASHQPSRAGSKKLRMSESIASSIGSNLHRLGQNPQTGVLDLSKIILTDDYFSDVNPRSMRRLMNVIYITVRLLKAFQIDFSWYRLSSWINLTEQWPLRASMIVLQHDQNGDALDDTASLQSVYEKVRPKISCLREAAPLLELDRDERKLDAFLQLHKSDLLVSDLRIFLPFTINLDPYLRKVLKEDQQAFEDEGAPIGIVTKPQSASNVIRFMPPTGTPYIPPIYPTATPSSIMPYQFYSDGNNYSPVMQMAASNAATAEFAYKNKNLFNNLSEPPSEAILKAMESSSFPEDILQMNLSELTTDGVINLLEKIEDLRPTIEKLSPILKQNAINGRVLKYCDLNELKSVLELNFGHWELFRLLITILRDCEKFHSKTKLNKQKSIESSTVIDITDSTPTASIVPSVPPPTQRKSTQMEKQNKLLEYEYLQVTLEEQMIVGALSTLNEDAYEDVTNSDRPSPSGLSSESIMINLPTTVSSGRPPIPNSPSTARRDSILKQGPTSIYKPERRVSIKQDNLAINKNIAHLEYLYEKPENFERCRSLSAGSGAVRPNTLLLNKNERTHFKLMRSSSVDYDDAETNPTKTAEVEEDENAPLVFTIVKGNK
ncbi:kinase D-interacting substrate of 220 kDa B isoform X3 [Condylostylus longicornis]|uniref:kinase D-interacting substrate of 220 kDa B isoform X3 n=1 Tax=Condylostylus longicornis TaxID=2530218 RepID=UPI00244DCE84|nr:kinase D-interacting substrate of 220 kDa B isoform X3 [Condylostylus longicornis]